ncbi:MAG TPA: aminopeptidase [Verrucomicrobiae bacterium]|nr:aminopeptidase [Verrucomicrobiae bacterium]
MRNPAQIRLPEISLSHYLTQLRRSPYSWLILLGTLVGSIVSGCSPIYVLRAAYEEGKILWRREPIANFIQNVEVPQDTNEKLRLVLAVREYARDVLKLNVRGSYSSYSYVDRPDLTYIVVAAPKTELRPYTWWFLIVGSVPYKGYFSKQDAEAEIERLKAEGYDTNMRTSAAFSTLGWFDDPLLSHLLKYDRVMLSEIVFHELFHNTLYLKGASAFNESVANFIGHRASIDFFRERSGEGSAEHLRATQLWDDEREFGAFIAEVAGTLAELYGRDIAKDDKLRLREEIFARAKAEWARRVADRPVQRFRGFSQQPLNNAVLMHYLVYLKDLDLFESIYESSGRNLVRTIEAIRTAVRDRGEPFEALRAWLDKSQTNQSAARH